MLTNDKFSVDNLDKNELLDLNGGGPDDYKAGYRLGTAIREAISDGWDYVKGLGTGLFS